MQNEDDVSVDSLSSMTQETNEDMWSTRRNCVFTILVFSAVILTYIIYNPTTFKTVETIASGMVLLAGTVITAYVGGGVIDDRTIMKSLRQEEIRQSKWEKRKMVIIVTFAYCGLMISYILFTTNEIAQKDTELLNSISNSLIFLMGSTLITFIFGASVDDWNYNKAKAGDAWKR